MTNQHCQPEHHAEDCRRAQSSFLGSGHKALDPERCERCRCLIHKLDEARDRRLARA